MVFNFQVNMIFDSCITWLDIAAGNSGLCGALEVGLVFGGILAPGGGGPLGPMGLIGIPMGPIGPIGPPIPGGIGPIGPPIGGMPIGGIGPIPIKINQLHEAIYYC